MIPKNTIDEIFETVKIEEVISDFITLKKRGVNLLGLCPFHNEKTPSFTVSPTKGIYKCFGCGEGGNSVSFLMDKEHYTYPEALKYLAKKYNIEIVEEEMTIEQAKARKTILLAKINMYYCYIKKSLFSLIILFFMHSLIYASFPIEDINENAINSFF